MKLVKVRLYGVRFTRLEVTSGEVFWLFFFVVLALVHTAQRLRHPEMSETELLLSALAVVVP